MKNEQKKNKNKNKEARTLAEEAVSQTNGGGGKEVGKRRRRKKRGREGKERLESKSERVRE